MTETLEKKPKKSLRRKFIELGIYEILIYLSIFPQEVKKIPVVYDIFLWIHQAFLKYLLPTGSLRDNEFRLLMGDLVEWFQNPYGTMMILLVAPTVFLLFIGALISPVFRIFKRKEKEEIEPFEDSEKEWKTRLQKVANREAWKRKLLPFKKTKKKPQTNGGIKKKMRKLIGYNGILSWPKKLRVNFNHALLRKSGAKDVMEIKETYVRIQKFGSKEDRFDKVFSFGLNNQVRASADDPLKIYKKTVQIGEKVSEKVFLAIGRGAEKELILNEPWAICQDDENGKKVIAYVITWIGGKE